MLANGYIIKRETLKQRKSIMTLNYVLICKRTQSPINWATFNQAPVDPSYGYWIVQGE